MNAISELLDLSKENIEDLRYLGYSYIRQGHYDIALKFFEGLILLTDKNIYDYQTLGALYLQTSQYSLAKKLLEEALSLDTSHSLTKLNYAKTLLLLGQRDQGLLTSHELTSDKEKSIADDAQALILAYTS